MDKKTAFVSSADHHYFPMLAEWVHSIRRFPQSETFDICIFNAGLKPKQVAYLESQGCIVKEADWPCHIPESKIQGREFLKSCVCRPFIPDYFLNYDTYFWMDADTWVQRWEAVEMFLEGAESGRMTLTAQVDRAYPRPIRVQWLGPFPLKIKNFYYSNARKAYDIKTAQKLMMNYVLSAGAFAMKANAPHWKAWQDTLKKTLKKGNVFTAEQLSLGIICHLHGLPYESLPAYSHWLCQFKPLWDAEKSAFVEPSLPHEPLGILHLSGWDKMRLDRSVKTEFHTTDGGTITRSYRYPFLDGQSV